MGTGPDLLYAQEQTLTGDFDESAGMRADVADTEHLAGIAVVAVLDDGDVNVDNVATLELLVAGYAMANLMIDRGADRLGEATVIQRCGYGVLFIDDVIVANLIEFLGGYTDVDVRVYHVQYLSRQTAGDTHFFDVFSSFDGDVHERSVMIRYLL